jgi:hypothetical protein
LVALILWEEGLVDFPHSCHLGPEISALGVSMDASFPEGVKWAMTPKKRQIQREWGGIQGGQISIDHPPAG